MLFEIQPRNDTYELSPAGLATMPPASLGLLEKHIEQWLVSHPEVLLPGEQLLVLAQSVSGQSMADILALDSAGRLIVVEIKRDWSSRETIGQLLEYAAKLSDCGYDVLERVARKYQADESLDLLATFQKAFPESPVSRDQLGKAQRIFVVAPEADENLRMIVAWLTKHRVPIQLVPFVIYADPGKSPRFLAIDGVVAPTEDEAGGESWAGHWIFNTNETHAPGAYRRMFERGVAAIYGYQNGPQNLEGARKDDIVLAYVNQQGLRAVGRVVDGRVKAGAGVFLDGQGRQQPSEYHLEVKWEGILGSKAALSARDATGLFGYSLPVRTVFGRLHQGARAAALEKEIRKRALAERSV